MFVTSGTYVKGFTVAHSYIVCICFSSIISALLLNEALAQYKANENS